MAKATLFATARATAAAACAWCASISAVSRSFSRSSSSSSSSTMTSRTHPHHRNLTHPRTPPRTASIVSASAFALLLLATTLALTALHPLQPASANIADSWNTLDLVPGASPLSQSFSVLNLDDASNAMFDPDTDPLARDWQLLVASVTGGTGSSSGEGTGSYDSSSSGEGTGSHDSSSSSSAEGTGSYDSSSSSSGEGTGSYDSSSSSSGGGTGSYDSSSSGEGTGTSSSSGGGTGTYDSSSSSGEGTGVFDSSSSGLSTVAYDSSSSSSSSTGTIDNLVQPTSATLLVSNVSQTVCYGGAVALTPSLLVLPSNATAQSVRVTLALVDVFAASSSIGTDPAYLHSLGSIAIDPTLIAGATTTATSNTTTAFASLTFDGNATETTSTSRFITFTTPSINDAILALRALTFHSLISMYTARVALQVAVSIEVTRFANLPSLVANDTLFIDLSVLLAPSVTPVDPNAFSDLQGVLNIPVAIPPLSVNATAGHSLQLVADSVYGIANVSAAVLLAANVTVRPSNDTTSVASRLTLVGDVIGINAVLAHFTYTFTGCGAACTLTAGISFSVTDLFISGACRDSDYQRVLVSVRYDLRIDGIVNAVLASNTPGVVVLQFPTLPDAYMLPNGYNLPANISMPTSYKIYNASTFAALVDPAAAGSRTLLANVSRNASTLLQRVALTTLPPMTQVWLGVQIVNDAGTSENLAPVFVDTAPFLPTAVVNLSVIDYTDTQIRISFAPPVDPGTRAVESYDVSYDSSAGSFAFSLLVNQSTSAVPLSALAPFTRYSIRVCARSFAGLGVCTTVVQTTRSSGPTIVSFVASDPQNTDDWYGVNDVVTITFNIDTNQPPIGTQQQVDAVFAFSRPIALSYTGSWSTPSSAVILITQALPTTHTTSVLSDGTEVTLDPDAPPIGNMTVRVVGTGDVAVRTADGTSQPSTSTSPLLSGSWGTNSLWGTFLVLPNTTAALTSNNTSLRPLGVTTSTPPVTSTTMYRVVVSVIAPLYVNSSLVRVGSATGSTTNGPFLDVTQFVAVINGTLTDLSTALSLVWFQPASYQNGVVSFLIAVYHPSLPNQPLVSRVLQLTFNVPNSTPLILLPATLYTAGISAALQQRSRVAWNSTITPASYGAPDTFTLAAMGHLVGSSSDSNSSSTATTAPEIRFIEIYDADTPPNSNVSFTVRIQSSYTGLLFFDAGTAAAGVTYQPDIDALSASGAPTVVLTGSLTQVNLALRRLAVKMDYALQWPGYPADYALRLTVIDSGKNTGDRRMGTRAEFPLKVVCSGAFLADSSASSSSSSPTATQVRRADLAPNGNSFVLLVEPSLSPSVLDNAGVVACSSVFTSATVASFGASPVCVFESTTRLRVQLDLRASLAGGSTVVVKSGAFSRCGTSSPSVDTTVTLGTVLDQNPQLDLTATVTAPSISSVCDLTSLQPLMLSSFARLPASVSSSSSLASLAAWTFPSSLAALSPSSYASPSGGALLLNGSMFEQYLNTESTFAFAWNTSDATQRPVSAVAQVTFKPASTARPYLVPDTPTLIYSASGAAVSLGVDARAPCAVSGVPANITSSLIYEWSMNPTVPAFATASTSSPRLRLPRDSLTCTSSQQACTFQFSVAAYTDNTRSDAVRQDFTVVVPPTPIRAVITGGTRRTVSSTDALVLDGSSSPGTSASTAGTWSCTMSFNPSVSNTTGLQRCSDSTGALLTFGTNLTQTLPAGTLSPNTYLFTLTIVDQYAQTVQYANQTTVVPFLPTASYSLGIMSSVASTARIVSSFSRVYMGAFFTGNGTTTAQPTGTSLQWTVRGGVSDTTLLSGVASTSTSLVLNPNSTVDAFVPGSTVEVKLALVNGTSSGSSSDAQVLATAYSYFYVRKPPSCLSSAFSISPDSGTALSTAFSLRIMPLQCYDPDGTDTLGLRYRFFRLDASTGRLVFLSESSADVEMDGIRLPLAASITLGVRITGTSGAYVDMYTNTSTQLNVAFTADFALGLVPTLASMTDVQQASSFAIALLETAAATSSANITDSDMSAVKDSMFNSINQVLTTASLDLATQTLAAFVSNVNTTSATLVSNVLSSLITAIGSSSTDTLTPAAISSAASVLNSLAAWLSANADLTGAGSGGSAGNSSLLFSSSSSLSSSLSALSSSSSTGAAAPSRRLLASRPSSSPLAWTTTMRHLLATAPTNTPNTVSWVLLLSELFRGLSAQLGGINDPLFLTDLTPSGVIDRFLASQTAVTTRLGATVSASGFSAMGYTTIDLAIQQASGSQFDNVANPVRLSDAYFIGVYSNGANVSSFTSGAAVDVIVPTTVSVSGSCANVAVATGKVCTVECRALRLSTGTFEYDNVQTLYPEVLQDGSPNSATCRLTAPSLVILFRVVRDRVYPSSSTGGSGGGGSTGNGASSTSVRVTLTQVYTNSLSFRTTFIDDLNQVTGEPKSRFLVQGVDSSTGVTVVSFLILDGNFTRSSVDVYAVLVGLSSSAFVNTVYLQHVDTTTWSMLCADQQYRLSCGDQSKATAAWLIPAIATASVVGGLMIFGAVFLVRVRVTRRDKMDDVFITSSRLGKQLLYTPQSSRLHDGSSSGDTMGGGGGGGGRGKRGPYVTERSINSSVGSSGGSSSGSGSSYSRSRSTVADASYVPPTMISDVTLVTGATTNLDPVLDPTVGRIDADMISEPVIVENEEQAAHLARMAYDTRPAVVHRYVDDDQGAATFKYAEESAVSGAAPSASTRHFMYRDDGDDESSSASQVSEPSLSGRSSSSISDASVSFSRSSASMSMSASAASTGLSRRRVAGAAGGAGAGAGAGVATSAAASRFRYSPEQSVSGSSNAGVEVDDIDFSSSSSRSSGGGGGGSSLTHRSRGARITYSAERGGAGVSSSVSRGARVQYSAEGAGAAGAGAGPRVQYSAEQSAVGQRVQYSAENSESGAHFQYVAAEPGSQSRANVRYVLDNMSESSALGPDSVEPSVMLSQFSTNASLELDPTSTVGRVGGAGAAGAAAGAAGAAGTAGAVAGSSSSTTAGDDGGRPSGGGNGGNGGGKRQIPVVRPGRR